MSHNFDLEEFMFEQTEIFVFRFSFSTKKQHILIAVPPIKKMVNWLSTKREQIVLKGA